MRWWWQSRTESPEDENAGRQAVIDRLAAALQHPGEDRQHKAAEQLAAIGHPLALRWSLQRIARSESAEKAVHFLERFINPFTQALDTRSLTELAELADPLQKIPQATITRHGKPLRGTWETYRAIDCAPLRLKAREELKRRAAARGLQRLATELLDAGIEAQPSAV